MTADVQRFADKVIQLIRGDVEAGAVPVTVTGFEQLHDHVDANMYLEWAGQVYDPDRPGCIEEIRQIEDEVSRRLAAGVLHTG